VQKKHKIKGKVSASIVRNSFMSQPQPQEIHNNASASTAGNSSMLLLTNASGYIIMNSSVSDDVSSDSLKNIGNSFQTKETSLQF